MEIDVNADRLVKDSAGTAHRLALLPDRMRSTISAQHTAALDHEGDQRHPILIIFQDRNREPCWIHPAFEEGGTVPEQILWRDRSLDTVTGFFPSLARGDTVPRRDMFEDDAELRERSEDLLDCPDGPLLAQTVLDEAAGRIGNHLGVHQQDAVVLFHEREEREQRLDAPEIDAIRAVRRSVLRVELSGKQVIVPKCFLELS